ncbi:uncharacterized protein METZ01_LOCUS134647 [marine metagenome]|uniref:Uncharacterized protein n=1 Tax=marine metagenome TaxID=408172 RepID=A0A381YYY2_9ZZZZ
MAEVEYKGIKFSGGKLLIILPLLGTIGGGLWGGFELWHRYQAMEVKIAKYVAPDLSGFDKKLAVLKKEMEGVIHKAESKLKIAEARVEVIISEFESLKNEVKAFEKLEEGIKQTAEDARDYTKEAKREVKTEMHHMEGQIENIEKRGKEAFRLVRESIETNDTKVRTMITVNSDRFDKRREQLRKDMDALEVRIKKEMKDLKKSINDKIKKALENPLANMRK